MTVLASAPALPLHTAGPYVAAAYIVLVVMLVVYLGIMTLRARRTRRDLSALRSELAERRAAEELDGRPTSGTERREPEREVAR
jgi:flagellar biosynthesis/type III secretory pathway M-ring protein FliF/YscJ